MAILIACYPYDSQKLLILTSELKNHQIFWHFFIAHEIYWMAAGDFLIQVRKSLGFHSKLHPCFRKLFGKGDFFSGLIRRPSADKGSFFWTTSGFSGFLGDWSYLRLWTNLIIFWDIIWKLRQNAIDWSPGFWHSMKFDPRGRTYKITHFRSFTAVINLIGRKTFPPPAVNLDWF